MPDVADSNVSDQSRSAEQDDDAQGTGADREPTAEEEATADALPPLDEKVAEHYEHQSKIGADIEGEGQIG